MFGRLAFQAGGALVILSGAVLMIVAAILAGAEAYGMVPALIGGGGALCLAGLVVLLAVRRSSRPRLPSEETWSLLIVAGMRVLPLLLGTAVPGFNARPVRANLLGLAVLAALEALARDRPKA